MLPDWVILLLLPFKIIFYALEALFIMALPYKLRKKKSVGGDIAVITGGGSGIGRQLSIKLANLGVKTVIWDCNAKAAESVVRDIRNLGGESRFYCCDVSSRSAVYEAAERVRNDIGEVTILINNAGIVNGKTLLEVNDGKVEQLFGVNTLAHFWTVKAFLPHMIKQQRGHIVTMSSAAAVAGICKMGDYCASKAAVSVLHEAISGEILAGGYHGINMTLVSPYLANTGMFAGAVSRFPRIIPILEPEYLATQIVQSILLNERNLILPRIMRILIPLYRILPQRVIESSDDIFGMRGAMEKFVGRNQTEA